MKYDIVLLTADKFLNSPTLNKYNSNVILEDNIVKSKLEELGLKVKIVSWSDSNFDFSQTKIALFRTIWDYFDRFQEFKLWLENVKHNTILINSYDTINWNMDKHYLLDLQKAGINIPKSVFINKGEVVDFYILFNNKEYDEIVVKPTISGAAKNTFRLSKHNYYEKDKLINNLFKEQDFIIQPFIKSITNFGEISIMLIDGEYTHAVIKKAKKGDYRVQDDHGGSVELYNPTKQQIDFAIETYNACNPKPLYARVDIVIDNDKNLAISELELIEPEFWYRFNESAATKLVKAIRNKYF